jgi:hypothetical protein
MPLVRTDRNFAYCEGPPDQGVTIYHLLPVFISDGRHLNQYRPTERSCVRIAAGAPLILNDIDFHERTI